MIKNILTKREREIFEMLVYFKGNSYISEKLNISEKTVRNHISNVIQKIGVKGRTQAVLELVRLKEISISHLIG